MPARRRQRLVLADLPRPNGYVSPFQSLGRRRKSPISNNMPIKPITGYT